METKFNVTHIGGRSGTIDFPKDTVFNDSINYSIFENLFSQQLRVVYIF